MPRVRKIPKKPYITRALKAFEPPESLSVAEWAEKNIILPELTCPEPGPLRISRTPYTRGPLEAFNSRYIEWIVLLWGRQLGKSQGVQYPCLCYGIAQDPGPALFLLPSETLAEYTSAIRIQPMIEASPSLREKKTADKNDYTTLEMKFRNMILSLAGTGSGSQVMSRPVRYLFRDEVDEFKPGVGQDATDPMESSKQTTSNFANRKIVDSSTPTNTGGNIWREFKDCSAVFEFWLTCPHCGGSRPILWEDIKFGEERDPEIVRTLAWYECRLCQAKIRNHEKVAMLAGGEWRARMFKDAAEQILENKPIVLNDTISLADALREHEVRKVGFHLPKWYSPFQGGSIGEAAKEFLDAQDDFEAMQIWTKYWRALPWQEKISEKTMEDVITLRQEYREGEVPEAAVILTGGADVQKGIIYYVIRAWAANGESWLVRNGEVEAFEDLGALFFGSRYAQIGTGREFSVRLADVDSGYRTDEVYDFCRRWPKQARAIKGASRKMKAPYDSTPLDYYPDGRRLTGGLRLWEIDTGYWKDFIARRMQGDDQHPIKWHVHSEISQKYAEQIVSEHKTVRKEGKKILEEWKLKPGHKYNHYFDAEVYAAAAADMVGVKFLALARPKEAPPPEEPKVTTPAQIEARTMPGRRSEMAKEPWINVSGRSGWIRRR